MYLPFKKNLEIVKSKIINDGGDVRSTCKHSGHSRELLACASDLPPAWPITWSNLQVCGPSTLLKIPED